MRGWLSRARRPGITLGLAAMMVLALGFIPAGAGTDLLAGPPGTVLTITVDNCTETPAAALLNGSSLVAVSTGQPGSGFAVLTVPVSATPGTTLTIKSACLNYYNTPAFEQPDESFLVTDGSSAAFNTPGGIVGLETSDGVLSDLSTEPVAAGAPSGVEFPYGMFSFTVSELAPGATIEVTFTLPAPVNTYWKFQGGVWSQFAGAAFAGNDVIVTLTDGGAGDGDGVENGEIVDPGAPGISNAAAAVTLTPGFTG
jgi:hypothetical protein